MILTAPTDVGLVNSKDFALRMLQYGQVRDGAQRLTLRPDRPLIG
jgi:hypothetical protein